MIEQDYFTDSIETRMALFDFAFDHAPIGIAVTDLHGRILRGNSALATLVGIPLPRLAGTLFSEFTHTDDLDSHLPLVNAVLRRERDGYTVEKRFLRGHDVVHALIHVAAMRNASGQVVRYISQVEDITRQKENERQLAERATQLELAMEAIHGGFWHMDLQRGTFETSEQLAEFIGGEAAARLDLEHYLGKINADDALAADLAPLVSGQVDQSVATYRLHTVAGEKWMRCDRRLLRDPAGKPIKIVGVAIDFTQEHDRIEDLQGRSESDVLTELLNRRGLRRRFGQMLSADGLSVLAIDLDGFKAVND